MADDEGDQLERDLGAAIERGDLAAAKHLSSLHLERERRWANEANRSITLRNWAAQVRAEMECTEGDPLGRRVLERRRQINQLRDAEKLMRETVDQWPVLRRGAFPPGEDMDRAFVALTAATEAMERLADEMTTALWVTVPPSKRARSHRDDQQEALAGLAKVRLHDRAQADRDAREAEAHGRQARAHHVEAADVDELIIGELVAEGVSEHDAVMATIDKVPDKAAMKKRKRTRAKWTRENRDRLFLFHARRRTR